MSGRVEVTHGPQALGTRDIWAHTDRYVGKILHIKAGQALSVQYHKRKDETVYLLVGRAEVLGAAAGRATSCATMRAQGGRVVPHHAGHVHYMEAVTDCDVLEARTPELDDVVRLKDRYGAKARREPERTP